MCSMMRNCVAAAVVAVGLVSFGESRIFYWKNNSSTAYSFGSTNSWVIGTSSEGEVPTSAPGEEDWLHYTTGYSMTQTFDLDGSSYSVKGVSHQDASHQYGYRYMNSMVIVI